VSPTGLDHDALAAGLGGVRGADARARLGTALGSEPSGCWERKLLDAAAEPDERLRTARINEELAELDSLAGRWVGVPRVCARLSTSVGFLCATVSLLQGLALPAGDDALSEGIHAALLAAVGSLATGIAGTSFCAAVHFRALRARTGRAVAADRLVLALVQEG
jgi:hypothetical protein